ncbi:ferrochelatase, putative [Eimeria necatrix]|uniref:Ferrochelatase n=1 Tax=Eimeria necatrix TaxID=51315 RepID=U6MY97_9EIME|nr:ferrochelatase, putative [Eimeria necatrix]CDJ66655.1 ferrochelatase, putative [Eimeria necatrix]
MPLTRALRARGIAAPCIPGSSYSGGNCSSCSSCSNTFLRKFNTNAHNSSSERKQCSSGTTTATSDSWRGTHRHHQHHQRWQKHQQQIRNKEQQLLSAAAKRWQQLWHAGNPHAPQPFDSVNNGNNSCSGRTSSTEWCTSRNSGNSSCKDVVHVVLLNLGSPLRPTYTAVWRYLKRLSQRRYASVWLSPSAVQNRLSSAAAALQQRKQLLHQQGSSLLLQQLQRVLEGGSAPPLPVYLFSLAARLQQRLDLLQKQQHEHRRFVPRFEVSACVRYGDPDVSAVLQKLQKQHQQLKLLFIPLYPQPTASCTASAYDAVFHEIRKWRVMPDLRMVSGYWNNEAYIDSVAASVKQFWDQHGRGDHLLFSYHGIPRDVSWAAGDPYACYCFQTTRLVAERLDLKPGEYEVAMQSRTGCAEWTQPYFIPALEALAKAGCRRLDVVCPGFAADCLETLEEVQTEAANYFAGFTDGQGELRVVPCLNDTDEAVAVLESLVLENTKQWRPKPR